MHDSFDFIVVGAGPAGASAAAHAARAGARVCILERQFSGRDKSCGDGLTPRALRELDRLGVSLAGSHSITGLRIVRDRDSGPHLREVPWPVRAGFGPNGATMRRRLLDARVLSAALDAGASLRERATVDSLCWEERGAHRVSGVRLTDGSVLHAPFVALACGAGSALASSVGATRARDMLQGVAIRAYAPSSNHADTWLEASITLAAPGELPGYGWIFPLGDGSVNIGYGTLTHGKKSANLRAELARYHERVAPRWGLGPFVDDWAWRLPMHVQHRSGAGWVALGDAAGLVNPCNGEGIDYALESGRFAAEAFCGSRDPIEAAGAYELRLVREVDWFLAAARRFAGSLRSPRLLDALLVTAMSSQWTMSLTAAVLGNVLSSDTRGGLEGTVRAADRVLRLVQRA